MKKRDLYLAAALLLAAAVLFFVMRIGNQEEGSQVKITVDGETYGVYSLWEEQEIEIKGTAGENRIRIEDGKVRMIAADCPDGYCMDQGAIHRAAETIVCLPHKVVVEVITQDEIEDSVDLIVK